MSCVSTSSFYRCTTCSLPTSAGLSLPASTKCTSSRCSARAPDRLQAGARCRGSGNLADVDHDAADQTCRRMAQVGSHRLIEAVRTEGRVAPRRWGQEGVRVAGGRGGRGGGGLLGGRVGARRFARGFARASWRWGRRGWRAGRPWRPRAASCRCGAHCGASQHTIRRAGGWVGACGRGVGACGRVQKEVSAKGGECKRR